MPFVDLGKSKTSWKLPKGRQHKAVGPEVSVLGKSKILRLNDEAFGILERPTRVMVAWDVDSRRLGIKKAEPDDKDAYTLTVTKSGGYVVSAAALFRSIGISAKQSGWLAAEKDGEYLAFSPFEGAQSAQGCAG